MSNKSRVRHTFLGIALIVLFFFIGTWLLFNFNSQTNYQNSFSDYGTFMAGTLGIILSAINVYFLLQIWDEQKTLSIQQQTEQKQLSDNQRIEQAVKYEQDKIEARFFNLLGMRKEMRDEIKHFYYDTKKGNDAINRIATDIKKIYEGNDDDKRLENLRAQYRAHSLYLRSYFDMILFIMEFIDKQESLPTYQKIDYIQVLIASSTNNEVLVWCLMDKDDNTTEENNQRTRFAKMITTYNILSSKY